jgi:hypothetical protein
MCRRLVGVGLLLAALILYFSPSGYAQKDRTAPDGVDSSKLASGEYVGLLKTVPGSDRLFSLEVQTVKYVPSGRNYGRLPRLTGNTGPVRTYNNSVNRLVKLQNQLVQANQKYNSAKTLKAQQSALRKVNSVSAQIQNEVAKLQLAAVGVRTQLAALGTTVPGFKAQVSKQTIDFQATEDVKVRTMILPEQFDDKGNIKKYTKEEKEALKGKDRTLPGYESSLENLQVGQKLRVVLAPVKKKPAEKDKDKDADLDKDKDAEKKMQVKLIVILEEAPDTNPKGKGKKKKDE